MRHLTYFLVIALLGAACSDSDAADPDRLCEINTEIEQLPDFFEAPPDEARATVERARSLLDEAEKVAPDEIRSTVEAASDSFRQVLDLFEAADFDIEQVNEAELEAFFDDEEEEAVSDDLDAWVDANCST